MEKFRLAKINPGAHPLIKSKEEAIGKTLKLQRQLYNLFYLMFAHNKQSLLIILQGIDTAGKDGTVRHIFSAANPQGINVFSFKQPTPEESKHDFLWRCHRHTPESGLTTIFNRSYYEEVITTMVHPKLLEVQHLPDSTLRRKDFFQRRYKRINEFENLLAQKGTVVVKFFLHISKDEQRTRIENRLQNRNKNWKFSMADVKEREHWDEYVQAFEKMLNNTSTKASPWVVIPANLKWYRDYVVSRTLVTVLKKMKMEFPRVELK